MKKYQGNLLVLPVIICMLLCCGQDDQNQSAPTAPVISEGGPPNIDEWTLIFIDDFTGDKLDRKLWDPYYTWGKSGTIERHHNYDATVLEENVIIENGLMRLKCEKDTQKKHEYTYSLAAGD